MSAPTVLVPDSVVTANETTLNSRQVESLRSYYGHFARWQDDWAHYQQARAKAEERVQLFMDAIQQRRLQVELEVRGAGMMWALDHERDCAR